MNESIIVIEVKISELDEVLCDIQQVCMRRNPLDEPFIKEFKSKSEMAEWYGMEEK